MAKRKTPTPKESTVRMPFSEWLEMSVKASAWERFLDYLASERLTKPTRKRR